MVAQSIAESQMQQPEIDQDAIAALGEAIHEATLESILFDFDIPLVNHESLTTRTSSGKRGSWAHDIRYRYPSDIAAGSAELFIDIELSYTSAHGHSIGVQEIDMRVRRVYPRARISVEMRSPDGEILWKDSASYKSRTAVTHGSVGIFGVPIVQDYQDDNDFLDFYHEALNKLRKKS